jgi:hypothetical protein
MLWGGRYWVDILALVDERVLCFSFNVQEIRLVVQGMNFVPSAVFCLAGGLVFNIHFCLGGELVFCIFAFAATFFKKRFAPLGELLILLRQNK